MEAFVVRVSNDSKVCLYIEPWLFVLIRGFSYTKILLYEKDQRFPVNWSLPRNFKVLSVTSRQHWE
jgi:hypothetical protein